MEMNTPSENRIDMNAVQNRKPIWMDFMCRVFAIWAPSFGTKKQRQKKNSTIARVVRRIKIMEKWIELNCQLEQQQQTRTLSKNLLMQN